jgi:hypothetical protein
MVELRYPTPNEFPLNEFPVISDYLLQLRSVAVQRPPPESVRALVGLYPARKPVRPLASLQFYSFNRTRSLYASLREMEDILGEFYLLSDIMPMVTPLPASFLAHPHDLPSRVAKTLRQRGALIYGSEE